MERHFVHITHGCTFMQTSMQVTNISKLNISCYWCFVNNENKTNPKKQWQHSLEAQIGTTSNRKKSLSSSSLLSQARVFKARFKKLRYQILLLPCYLQTPKCEVIQQSHCKCKLISEQFETKRLITLQRIYVLSKYPTPSL